MQRWLAWWEADHLRLDLRGSLPRQAYTLVLLAYLGLDPQQVPVVYEDEKTIIWRSTNFCPTLEACLRLGLDTRVVCRAATEAAVQALIARLDPRLCFSRNYATGLRPDADYCEEQITLETGALQIQNSVCWSAYPPGLKPAGSAGANRPPAGCAPPDAPGSRFATSFHLLSRSALFAGGLPA